MLVQLSMASIVGITHPMLSCCPADCCHQPQPIKALAGFLSSALTLTLCAQDGTSSTRCRDVPLDDAFRSCYQANLSARQNIPHCLHLLHTDTVQFAVAANCEVGIAGDEVDLVADAQLNIWLKFQDAMLRM